MPDFLHKHDRLCFVELLTDFCYNCRRHQILTRRNFQARLRNFANFRRDELVLELALSRDSLAPLAGSVRGPDSPASRRASNVPSLPPSRAWIEK